MRKPTQFERDDTSPGPDTASLLGDPPLVRGESADSYDELLARFCGTLRPRDCLEEIWIRDVVDLVWETYRLRRLKAALMTDDARSEIGRILSDHHPQGEALANNWALGGDEAEETLRSALGTAGLSMQTLTARAVTASYCLVKLQQIDRMLVSAEARRSAALRELDTHRGPLAGKLRLAIAREESGASLQPAPSDAPTPADERSRA